MKCPRCAKYGGHGWVVYQTYYVKNTRENNGAVEGLHCVICGWCLTRPRLGQRMKRKVRWKDPAQFFVWAPCKVGGCQTKIRVVPRATGFCAVHYKQLKNYKQLCKRSPKDQQPPEPYIKTPNGWVQNTLKNREKWKKGNTAEPVSTQDGKD